MNDKSPGEEAKSLYYEGRFALDAGDFDVAIKLFTESARLDPHFQTLFLLGQCLANTGQLVDAIVPLAAATSMNRQGIAPTLLADVFRKLGRLDDARDMIQIALARQPQYRKAHDVERVLRAMEH